MIKKIVNHLLDKGVTHYDYYTMIIVLMFVGIIGLLGCVVMIVAYLLGYVALHKLDHKYNHCGPKDFSDEEDTEDGEDY